MVPVMYVKGYKLPLESQVENVMPAYSSLQQLPHDHCIIYKILKLCHLVWQCLLGEKQKHVPRAFMLPPASRESIPIFISWCQVCMSFSHSWTNSYCMHIVLNCFIYSTNLLVSVAPIYKPISCQGINAKNFIVARYCISIISLLIMKSWKKGFNG